MAVPEALENLRDLFLTRSCPGCGARLRERGRLLCGWCSLRLYPPSAGRVFLSGAGIEAVSAFSHGGLPRELVIRLKYGGERHLAGCAARLIRERMDVLPGPGDLLVPVAASRERIRERGYDQAALMARQLARLTGSRLAALLEREDRPPQVGLPEEERRTNVSGAFSLARPLPEIEGLWLVDDVMTTGSTICDAARALRDGGAVSVAALTLTYRDTLSGSII
jgi:ComF family protein